MQKVILYSTMHWRVASASSDSCAEHWSAHWTYS